MSESATPPAAGQDFTLDRRTAVPALIGRHEDFLIVTGLARHRPRHRGADQ